jgi:salicylate hydroxylase
MLPTQGQGASQAIEDAEALGAFFAEQADSPSREEIGRIFEVV